MKSQSWPGVGVTNEVTINADVFRMGAGSLGRTRPAQFTLKKKKVLYNTEVM